MSRGGEREKERKKVEVRKKATYTKKGEDGRPTPLRLERGGGRGGQEVFNVSDISSGGRAVGGVAEKEG